MMTTAKVTSTSPKSSKTTIKHSIHHPFLRITLGRKRNTIELFKIGALQAMDFKLKTLITSQSVAYQKKHLNKWNNTMMMMMMMMML